MKPARVSRTALVPNVCVQLRAVLKVLLVPVPAKPSFDGPPYVPYVPGSNTTGRWKLKRYDRLSWPLAW